ncbi:MAG: lipopolysaccharide biosynthesis protein [Paracoccaceae bacterium]
MSINRRFSFGVAWMFMGGWAEQGVNFIVVVLLARLLGAEVFGLAAMSAALVILAEGLVRETLTEPLIARKDVEPGHLDAVFWILSVFSVAIALIIVGSAHWIALFYGDERVTGLTQAFTIGILLTGVAGVPIAILRREMDFRTLALRAIAGAVAGGVVGIGMALAGFGVWSLVGQRIGLLSVDTALVWAVARWRPGFTAGRRHFREVSGFGAKVLGLTTADLVSAQTPNVVIGAVLGPAALGIFTISWRLVEVAAVLLYTPVRMVAQPAFAALRHGGGSAAALLSDIAEVSSVLAISAFAGMAILAHPLVLLLLGPDWGEAAPVLQVLCLVGAYLCIERVQYAFCLAAGKAGGLAWLSLAQALLGIFAMIVAAPFGLVAVAIAFTVRYYALWPIRFAIVKRLGGMGITRCAEIVAPVIAGAAVMAGGVALWLRHAAASMPPVVLLASGIVIGAGIFLLFAALAFRRRIDTLRRLLAEDEGS